MTTREFTIGELDTLIAEATPGPWRGDRNDGTVKYAVLAGEHEEPIVVLSVDHKSGTHGFGCGYGDEDETRYATDAQADERLVLAAPDLAAFARRLLTEREVVARLHRQQVERLEDDAATVAAERDDLRATVDRLRAALAPPATYLLDASGAARPTHYDAPLGWAAVGHGPAVCAACGGAYVAYVNNRPSGCRHTPGCAALAQEAALDAYRRRTDPDALRALLADAPGIVPAGVPDVG